MKFHIFHSWSKWTEVTSTDIVRPSTGRVLGYAFIQSRVCSVCGYTQHKVEKIMA